MILTLLMLFNFTFNSAHAETVLMAAPTASEFDYQAMLRAHGEYQSPTQAYLATHPTKTNREQLVKAFASAQMAFLQDSNAGAREKFLGVLGLLLEDDWDHGDREAFLLAYFRLAQLETEQDARDLWLTQSLLLGGNVKLDESLVPPPLVARRLELAAHPTGKRSATTNFSSNWSAVLVNGQRCLNLDCEYWTRQRGKIRVTFLSDRLLPQSLKIDASDLATVVPKAIAYVEGNCSASHVHAQASDFKSNKVFWDLACEQTGPSLEKLKPQVTADVGVPRLNFNPHATPIYKSKWLWAGVGVAAAIIFMKSQQRRESKETTTSYGY